MAKSERTNLLIDKSPGAKRRFAQWQVPWLIEHSTSHQLLWCIDSLVLRNPLLRQAPKRCLQVFCDTL
jgi:hypothetical protein